MASRTHPYALLGEESVPAESRRSLEQFITMQVRWYAGGLPIQPAPVIGVPEPVRRLADIGRLRRGRGSRHAHAACCRDRVCFHALRPECAVTPDYCYQSTGCVRNSRAFPRMIGPISNCRTFETATFVLTATSGFVAKPNAVADCSCEEDAGGQVRPTASSGSRAQPDATVYSIASHPRTRSCASGKNVQLSMTNT